MKKLFIIFLKYYFPLFFWLGIIFYFSSIPGLRYSQENISLEIFLRKGAHIMEYAILSLLMWRLFFFGHKLNFQRALGLSFFLASFYAISDEFHQTLTPSRAGRLADVIFDSISIILGLGLITFFYQKKKSWRFGGSLFFLVVILLGMEYFMWLENHSKKEREDIRLEEKKNDLIEPSENSYPSGEENKKEIEEPKKNEKEEAFILPEKINIAVPFTSQAPFANWDERHEEACEEASLVMLKYYLDNYKAGKKLATIPQEEAEKEIQGLIDYQIKKYGDYKDTNTQRTLEIARDYYKIKNLKIIYDFSLDDLKKYLAQGKPVIIPAAGRKLGNPNFTAPGPLYHMLMIIGYEQDKIITNDPGTRKGASYQYEEDKLYAAIHDFPGKKEKIEKGRKAMIIIE